MRAADVLPPPKMLENLIWVIIICTAALMGYAKYSEYFLGLQPCALCITQQAAFTFLCSLSVFAKAFVRSNNWFKGYFGLAVFVSVLGAYVAGRQIWLQYFPGADTASCGPSLEYVLSALGVTDAIRTLFMGEASCGEITWSFLGLSMAGWALIWFVFFVMISAVGFKYTMTTSARLLKHSNIRV